MAELAEGSSIGPFPYHVVRRLGYRQGAMAYVYLASVGEYQPDGQTNLVAIKITRAEDEHAEFFRLTLENEVERLRRLKHPGIVRLYPVQKHGLRNLPYMAQASLPGKPWFSVMEYLAGDSLSFLLKQQRTLDVGLAMEIARSLAATLDYLHNLNQVHLDIKPENILFREPIQSGREPQPVLIDFGISRTVGQTGLEAGTLQWSPPERVRHVRGEAAPELMVRPHPSMDIYALGMVLYAMIAGRLPYADRTRKGITTAILEGNPTAPSAYQPVVQRELDDLILMALAREPSQRPTADEMARALEEMAIRLGYRPRYGYLTPGATPSLPAISTTGGRRSKAWMVAAALGALVLLETGIILRPSVLAVGGTTTETPAPTATVLPSTTAPVPTEVPTATVAPPTATTGPTRVVQPSDTATTVTKATSTKVPTKTPTSTATRTRPPTVTPTSIATNAP